MNVQQMRGFTLIEVVIAFAILALSLAALYGAFASSLARTHRDAQFCESTMIAQSLLARAGSDIPSGQDRYSGEWNGYIYELTQETVSQSATASASMQPVVRVTAKVLWTTTTGSRDVEISTLKIVPRYGP